MGRKGRIFISAAKGRSRPEMSTPFDSLTPSFYMWSVGNFSLTLTVQKLFHVLISLEFNVGAQQFRGFADFRPLPWFSGFFQPGRAGSPIRQLMFPTRHLISWWTRHVCHWPPLWYQDELAHGDESGDWWGWCVGLSWGIGRLVWGWPQWWDWARTLWRC